MFSVRSVWHDAFCFLPATGNHRDNNDSGSGAPDGDSGNPNASQERGRSQAQPAEDGGFRE